MLATHPQFLLVRVSYDLVVPWLLTIVYGRPDYGLRRQLWADLDQNLLNIGLLDIWLMRLVLMNIGLLIGLQLFEIGFFSRDFLIWVFADLNSLEREGYLL